MKRIALMAEDAMQMQLVKLLDAYARPDIEWHHCPNGEDRHPAVARKLKDMGVKRGVADLQLTIDGKPYALELKTEIGIQSGAQEAYQERFERAGGIYLIAFGLNQAIDALKQIQAFRSNITITNALGKGARSGEGTASAGPLRTSVAIGGAA